MKILTREHSLEMARLIAELHNDKINANELTIQDPHVYPNGQVEVYVLNIDTSYSYKFILHNCDSIFLEEWVTGEM